MKEFIDKLISRLEELKTFKLNLADAMSELMKKDKLDNYISKEEVISIVNQLAEEYKHCDLCYLQSPCEYQNENAILPNELLADENGWIPCSERLPSKEEIEEWATFLVTIRVRGKYDIMDFCLFGTDGKWLVSEDREVIAWKRQTPYQPKGE